MPWFSLSFLWSAALISTCKWARNGMPGYESKLTVMAVYSTDNLLCLPFIQRLHTYEEEKRRRKKKVDKMKTEKHLSTLSSLRCAMLHPHHHIQAWSHSCHTHCTGLYLLSSKMLVASLWWKWAMPLSTGWNVFCIINVLYFILLYF